MNQSYLQLITINQENIPLDEINSQYNEYMNLCIDQILSNYPINTNDINDYDNDDVCFIIENEQSEIFINTISELHTIFSPSAKKLATIIMIIMQKKLFDWNEIIRSLLLSKGIDIILHYINSITCSHYYNNKNNDNITIEPLYQTLYFIQIIHKVINDSNYEWIALHSQLIQYYNDGKEYIIPQTFIFNQILICLNDEQSIHMLSQVIQFWNITFLPQSIIHIIRSTKLDFAMIVTTNEQICNTFQYIQSTDNNDFVRYAIKEKRLDLLIYADNNGYLNDQYEKLTLFTAYCGSPDCLNYLIQHANNHTAIENLYYYVIIGNNFDCLQYLYEKNGRLWNPSFLCYLAVSHTDLLCLKFIHETGYNFEESQYLFDEAARKGNYNCLVYLHEKKCHWDMWACKGAAESGNLECLKYLHENGCPWDTLACKAAAEYGNLECLKYLHENGCPWDCYGYAVAKINNQLECVEYMRRNNCPQSTFVYIALQLFNCYFQR